MLDRHPYHISKASDCRPFLDRLAAVFAHMDRAYAEVAGQYGFQCRGCEDNCCLTRFYHHTWVEYHHLEAGFSGLGADKREKVLAAAREVCREHATADRTGRKARIMCPLNSSGLCLVYAHRPMICRLHGIPHELRRPTGEIYRVPGCDDFSRQCGDGSYIEFNRTPLYVDLARLEQDFRKRFGLGKMERATIAEMLLRMPPGTGRRTKTPSNTAGNSR